MAMQYCPGCMRFLPATEKCYFCGFSMREYTPAGTALPIDAMVASYRVGAVLAQNRQAQFYCALPQDASDAVLLEEFFPHAVVGRRRGSHEIVCVQNQDNFKQACTMFRDSQADRGLPLIEAFEANNTIYRVYKLSTLQSPAEQCANLVNAPISFRSAGGGLTLTVNALSIPPMPHKRAYRSAPSGAGRRKLRLGIALGV